MGWRAPLRGTPADSRPPRLTRSRPSRSRPDPRPGSPPPRTYTAGSPGPGAGANGLAGGGAEQPLLPLPRLRAGASDWRPSRRRSCACARLVPGRRSAPGFERDAWEAGEEGKRPERRTEREEGGKKGEWGDREEGGRKRGKGVPGGGREGDRGGRVAKTEKLLLLGRRIPKEGPVLSPRQFLIPHGRQLKFHPPNGALGGGPCKTPTGSHHLPPRRAGLRVAPGAKHPQALSPMLRTTPAGSIIFSFFRLRNGHSRSQRAPRAGVLYLHSHRGWRGQEAEGRA